MQDKKLTTLKGAGFGTAPEYNQPSDTLVTQELSEEKSPKLVKRVRKAILNIYSIKLLYASLQLEK